MNTLITTLLLFTFLGVSSAYFCWDCSSDDFQDGATCADPFAKADSDLIKRQCSGDCFKEVITFGDGGVQYRRGCDACTKGCSTVGTTRTCRECCLGQLCNSADNVHVNQVAAIVTSCLATLYYFL
ncbi:uncharacterized protein LOC100893428 [Strongylocentrotus purpuratus]|uniref:Protein sleepless n=1 Tax=Strongylocentrotus purpuratus TaxID=7668 RepID=A0A7M7PBC0_STRPU|nr:uncharacterized protein LOC100893428 [Strongylocentrotus purpuratus]|eukprot:XP_011677048.1 PREDICTED: uncharacterized protein LOC100893428 [Strongylocentrotus purpuratus]